MPPSAALTSSSPKRTRQFKSQMTTPHPKLPKVKLTRMTPISMLLFCGSVRGFLRMGEFTNTATEFAVSGAAPRFSDVWMLASENYDIATLLLSRSIRCSSILLASVVILARTGGIVCPVAFCYYTPSPRDPQDQSDTLSALQMVPSTSYSSTFRSIFRALRNREYRILAK